MQLIIIQGESATGKTALAQRLAKDLQIRTFLKDGYKEQQYDGLGHIPSLWQWFKIDNDSWRQLYQAVKQATAEDYSLIIEGNFIARQRKMLSQLIAETTTVTEVYCYAAGKVILQRFKARHQQGERHISHRDNLWYPVLWLEVTAARLGWHWIKPLRLSEQTLLVETTDFAKVDYAGIRRFVKTSGDKTIG